MRAGARIGRMAMVVLWPAFLVAGIAEACFFALVDPAELPRAELLGSSRTVYALGFFFFWGITTLASLLTCYLTVAPDEGQPRA
jgi:hypothetical protein